MLSGDTEFRLYYGGFDATPTRSHAVRLDFNLYEGKPSKKSRVDIQGLRFQP